mgnify:FL=1|jgi:hypothetical protein|tara:strand:+ start:351 stop:806 length:456 start_codon:yes stop_codon:yes gene_type:complete
MISLLGSLLGFGTSFLPSILDFFKQAQAHKQKLEMMKMQSELLEKKSALRLQELDKQAEIKEVEGLYKHDASLDGGKFVNALRSSVRPVITYIFMGLFIAVEVSIIVKFMETGGDWTEAVNLLWSDEVAGLWSAILAFWFGNRAISKFQNK